MDLFGFINRGIALNVAQQEPVAVLSTNAEVIAEMMGIDAADVPREAETNPALEDLGDGVFRVWIGIAVPLDKR